MSTLRCTNLQDTSGGNSLTTAQIYNGACKAWVNFNGTGTVAIRAQFNVSSITDNGTGDYTVNFTSALADANYCVPSSVGDTTLSLANDASGLHPNTKSASSVRCLVGYSLSDGNLANFDYNQIDVAVFR